MAADTGRESLADTYRAMVTDYLRDGSSSEQALSAVRAVGGFGVAVGAIGIGVGVACWAGLRALGVSDNVWAGAALVAAGASLGLGMLLYAGVAESSVRLSRRPGRRHAPGTRPGRRVRSLVSRPALYIAMFGLIGLLACWSLEGWAASAHS